MRSLKLFAALPAAMLSGTMPARAQDDVATFVAGVQSLLPKLDGDIDALMRDAWILAALVVLIGVSGFVAGLVKGTDPRKYQLSIAAGITTVLLTTITSTFYDVDHRTLFKHVNEARLLHRAIETDMALRDGLDNPADRQTWKESIRGRVDRINELTGSAVFSVPFFSWRGVLPTAYAETSSQPDWVRYPPRSRVDLFFVGEAAGRSIEEARAAAEADATDKARAFVADLWPGSSAMPSSGGPAEAATELVAGLKFVETHLAYDRTQGRYRYYVLGRISRKVLEGRIWLAPVPMDKEAKSRLSEAVQQIEQATLK